VINMEGDFLKKSRDLLAYFYKKTKGDVNRAITENSPLIAETEKEGIVDSGGVISNMMQAWRKAPQHMVYFTQHEADQMETLIERVALCQGIAPQEKTEWIARAIDYKIQYEIQEEWEHRTEWIESPNEIISKVRTLDISQYGKVIGEFPGNSSYVVIVINQ